MPYIYNNHDLGINGASASSVISSIRKPVIRLKNIQKIQAINGLASMVNPSLKSASNNIDTIQRPDYNNKKSK